MLAARSVAHSWFGVLAAITLVGCASKPPEEVEQDQLFKRTRKITKVSFNEYRTPPSAVSPRRLAFTSLARSMRIFTPRSDTAS